MELPRLHYDILGSRGPHIVLLHGMLSSRAQWTPQLHWQRSYRLVLVELLGHGRSPAPRDPACYTPECYNKMLEKVRKECGARHWFVVAQSLGAGIAFHYCIANQHRVLGLVFTNSNTAFSSPEQLAAVTGNLTQVSALFETQGQQAVLTHRLNPSNGSSKWLPDHIRELFAADVALHDPIGLALSFRHTIPLSSVRGLIDQSFSIPVLLVSGDRETGFGD